MNSSGSAYHHVPSSTQLLKKEQDDDFEDDLNEYTDENDDEEEEEEEEDEDENENYFTITSSKSAYAPLPASSRKLNSTKESLLLATVPLQQLFENRKKELKEANKPRTKSFNDAEKSKETTNKTSLRESFKKTILQRLSSDTHAVSATSRRRKNSTEETTYEFKVSQNEEDDDDDDQIVRKALHINTAAASNNNNNEKINNCKTNEIASSGSTSSSSSYNSSSRSDTTLSASSNQLSKKIDFSRDQIKKFSNNTTTTPSTAKKANTITLDDLVTNSASSKSNINNKNAKNDTIRMRHHSNANKTILISQSDLVVNSSLINANINNTTSSSNALVDNNNNSTNVMSKLNASDDLKEMSSSAASSLDRPKLKIRSSKRNKRESKRSHNTLVIFLLFVVNLLNFIDRYTLAGVLKETQDYFKIDDSSSGLLQTVFICSYMLLAPLFGYLGDRYPRKWIIIFGVSFWSLMTFLGSYVPKDKFWVFLILRSLVGIGEASYSCIAPTIIGDLFTNQMRTKMLAIFYLAVPVGSGLGYIVGSNIASAFNDWRWALRFTPPLGFLCVVLLIFFVREPKRGGAEGGFNYEESNSSLMSDIIYLCKNRTFMWVTAGFTFSSFVLGGLSWWVPLYVQYAIYSKNQVPEQIPLMFGVVTCISGLLGVTLSMVTAPRLRAIRVYSDAIVCAFGSFVAVPSLFILIIITRDAHPAIFWLISAIAISALCLSWTLVSDILLYVIHPNKRSTASAFNILICHLFGDAGSPYVIGYISDYLRASKPDTYFNRFSSLQMALYAAPFFSALSFAAYLFSAIYLKEDKYKVDQLIKKDQKQEETNKEMNDSTSNENSRCDDFAVSGLVTNYNINPLVDSNDLLSEKLIKVKSINENSNPKRKLSSSSKHKLDKSDLNYK